MHLSGISAWLLSIACVVILSVLAEFVLPEGQINKYTKVIFSFVILLVIIMPLPKLFGKDFNLEKFLGKPDTSIQENYIYQVNINKLSALTDDLSQQIEKEGLLKVKISINADVLRENMEIFGVCVDLREMEYAKNFADKDIVKAKLKIADIVSGFDLLKDVSVEFKE